MSGIPGIGQRWQAVLKIRVTMIPRRRNWQPERHPGCAAAWKGAVGHQAALPSDPYIFRPTPGERKLKTISGLINYTA